MVAIVPQQIAKQIQSLSAEKRFIFIHPVYKMQRAVLGRLLDDAIYVRFRGEKLADADLKTQFEAALALQRVHPGLRHVILDECGRAQPLALASLLRHLDGLYSGARIILLSRLLPEGIFDEADIAQRAVFLPHDPNQMFWDYAQSSKKTLLEVRAFGDGRVHLNGKLLSSWDGALPRTLFFYLVDRAMVTRNQIFETFWPNLTPREATNVFHVTKRKISEVLGTELTVYGSGFYHISPKIQLSYDVALFNQLTQNGDSSELDIAALQQALSLYRADYLVSLTNGWVEQRREDLRQMCCDALATLAHHYETEDRPNEALALYLKLSRMKPEREDAALAIMQLYHQKLGLPNDALRVYRRLAKALRENLDVTPSQSLQQLAAEIEQQIA